jgi:hypothetical protein
VGAPRGAGLTAVAGAAAVVLVLLVVLPAVFLAVGALMCAVLGEALSGPPSQMLQRD